MVNAIEEQQTIQQETEEVLEEEILEEPEETITVQEETTTVDDATEEPEETEAKAEVSKKKKKGDNIVEERIYTIPLQRALVRPPKKRAPRAMQLLKIFVTKHMKMEVTVSEDDENLPQLVITQEVNEKIWGKGIEKPPRRIRVRVTKDRDRNVTVYLAEAA